MVSGLPLSLINRSEEILKIYENKDKKKKNYTQTSLFDENLNINNKIEQKKSIIEEEIEKINPYEMTPMDAINFLYKLKKEIKEKR